MTQEHKQRGSQLNRRSFMRGATTMGLAATGAALLQPLSAASAFAATTPSQDDSANAFVGRWGTTFTLNHRPFYFGGTNNYYLHYQSHFMIDDVLQAAAAMHLPVLRCWGFLDGNASNGFVMQPTPGVYPEEGYERFDYAVYKAGQLGIKLVVPLVNNWNDFGGMQQYVTWFGASQHDDFYTNPQIKEAYRNYIYHFLHRRNRYTGRLMKDEPTIMTWELANEPRCQSDPSGNTLLAWVLEFSSYIKLLDHVHLVSVGDEGFYNSDSSSSDWTINGSQGVDWKRLIALPTIDYGTLHLYPNGWGKDANWGTQWISDHIRDGHAEGKPVVLEEYGWSDLTTRDDIYRTWTNTVYTQGGNGDQFWILTGKQDDGTLYPNYDGYRVTYPSSTADILSAHAVQMRRK